MINLAITSSRNNIVRRRIKIVCTREGFAPRRGSARIYDETRANVHSCVALKSPGLFSFLEYRDERRVVIYVSMARSEMQIKRRDCSGNPISLESQPRGVRRSSYGGMFSVPLSSMYLCVCVCVCVCTYAYGCTRKSRVYVYVCSYASTMVKIAQWKARGKDIKRGFEARR